MLSPTSEALLTMTDRMVVLDSLLNPEPHLDGLTRNVRGWLYYHRLLGSTLHRSPENNSLSNAFRYLTHVVVQRNVSRNGRSYTTCGAGNTAFFGSGTVRSLAYLWHRAKFTDREIKPKLTDKIHESIKAPLEIFGQLPQRSPASIIFPHFPFRQIHR